MTLLFMPFARQKISAVLALFDGEVDIVVGVHAVGVNFVDAAGFDYGHVISLQVTVEASRWLVRVP